MNTTLDSKPKTGKLTWFGRGISLLTTLPFFMSVYMKLFPTQEVIQQMAPLGIPANLLMTLAILEGLCILIYLIPQTAVLGAILFTGYLGGAILTHLRIGQNATLQVVLGLLLWLGLYLREPRLRRILPIR